MASENFQAKTKVWKLYNKKVRLKHFVKGDLEPLNSASGYLIEKDLLLLLKLFMVVCINCLL